MLSAVFPLRLIDHAHCPKQYKYGSVFAWASSSLRRFRLKSNAPTSYPELVAVAHGSMPSSCQFDEDGPIVASQVQFYRHL
ncbi:hypothetical protein Y032_0568g45 [Ancylostoma ceylanicum]|uniref:Uncharacterized protein n=1 Tax=Ancylostoma ceylanicum TaxID=53326 RepID=A0A016WNR9_9BILA|nr:hypothetical protein Y032_0568g45 [Ancylostoma ceylanicum]